MRRTIPALLSALIAVGSLLGASPPAADAQQDAAAPEEALFFAMQIADESGAILAEPKLLGLPGVPLQMKLWQPGGTRQSRMDLWLEPAANDDGSYAVSFELSVPGKVTRGRGSMTLRSGEERSASVDYPGGRIDLQLVAFAVPSVEFDLYLKHGIRMLERSRHT